MVCPGNGQGCTWAGLAMDCAVKCLGWSYSGLSMGWARLDIGWNSMGLSVNRLCCPWAGLGSFGQRTTLSMSWAFCTRLRLSDSHHVLAKRSAGYVLGWRWSGLANDCAGRGQGRS
jgi:hypothetical protein